MAATPDDDFAALHSALARVAPGTPLREGLAQDNILVTTRLDPADLPWNWSLAARAYRLLRYGKSPLRPPTPAVTVYGAVWRRNQVTR